MERVLIHLGVAEFAEVSPSGIGGEKSDAEVIVVTSAGGVRGPSIGEGEVVFLEDLLSHKRR